MPIDLERDERRGWIVARATGVTTVEDVLELIRTSRTTIEQRMVPMLVDARDATGEITDAGVERAIGAVQQAVRVGGIGGHVALVAHDDALYVGMLRYETRCGEIGVRVIRVFRRMFDAERWLQIVSEARRFSSR